MNNIHANTLFRAKPLEQPLKKTKLCQVYRHITHYNLLYLFICCLKMPARIHARSSPPQKKPEQFTNCSGF